MNKEKILHNEYGLISNLKYILSEEYRTDKLLIIFTMLGLILSPFSHYLWGFITKYVIDIITYTEKVDKLVFTIIVGSIGYFLINSILSIVDTEKNWRLITVRFGFLLKKNRKVMSIKYELLENPLVLDCHYKAMNAVSNNNDGIEGLMRKFMDFMSIISVVAVGIIILGNLNVIIVIVIIVLAGINFYIKNKTNELCKKKIWDPMSNTWRKVEYMKNVTSDFNYAKDIRLQGLQDFMLKKFHKVNNIVFTSHKKNRTYWLVANEIGNVMWGVMQVMLYVWLIYSVIYKSMPIGNFSLYLTSSTTFFTYITYLFGSIDEMLNLSRGVDDFRTFMDIEELTGESEKIGDKEVPKSDGYEIVFENVSFKYPGADKYALENINLRIKRGERIAIVGLNGAGKTTFISLLMRLYEPTKGRILLNNIDIRKFSRKDYYSIFSPVFQNVNLYAFPLYSNVSMKDEENTDKNKVQEVINQTGLHEKINQLNKGIDTEILKVIYEDGVDLSGGEKQKLALSRALYKNGEFVVLDEPTAALDAIAEAKLYEDFDKLIGKRSAIYISHRLSSTKFCSNIVMFENGHIIESGTHDELLRKGGKYEEIFNLQAQYYMENNDELRMEAENA